MQRKNRKQIREYNAKIKSIGQDAANTLATQAVNSLFTMNFFSRVRFAFRLLFKIRSNRNGIE